MSIFRVLNNLFRFNRTNWKAVSLCFLAATVFWFFNALNKNYATNVRFPLKFEFDQKKFASSKPLPRDVYINVNGKGWDLLRKNMGFKLPVVSIPLEHPVETKRIVGSILPPLLASQLGNLKINHIVTDTLYLSIERRDSIKLKVVVDMAGITFKKGYGRTSPIVVLPDSIELQGPQSLIKALADSIVITLPENKLSVNFREQVEIPDNESIRRNPPVVEVIFEVGEVTQLEQKLKLSLINIPGLTRVNLGNDSILCWVQIPKSRTADFASAKLSAVLDLKDARNGAKKALPFISGLPPYATLLRADSIRLRLY